MSAIHHWTIVCDHEGCRSRFTADVVRARETRYLATHRGWSSRIVAVALTRRATLDLCPMHGDALASIAHLWGPVALAAARVLVSATDDELAAVRGHEALALRALGYRPPDEASAGRIES